MKLLDRVKHASRAVYQTLEREAEGLPSHEEALESSLSRLEGKLGNYERLVRQNAEYYDLVDSLCKQRDQWKEMFHKQSVENAAAQSFMNEQLEKASSIIARVVHLMNAERERAKRPLFQLDHKLDTGGAVRKRFAELLKDLEKEAPTEPDAFQRRDEIRSGGEEAEPSSP